MATVEQWRDRLESRLNARWFTELGAYDAYFEGDHQLAFATHKYQEAFAGLLRALADNWMPLVVESSVERLKVQGFRFGTSGADEDAWAIWQANDLDAESDMAHTEAVKLKESYWLVEPRGAGEIPQVTVEHPSQFIVACDPANRRRRIAALKKWVGEDGLAYCNLYLPDEVVKWQSKGELTKGGMQGTQIMWERRRDDPGAPNPLGEVPGIPIRNAPSMLAGGQSDLKVAIPLQDAINKLLADMLIGAEYQAFPQRVLLGIDLPKDPQTGQPTRAAQLQASQQRIWTIANPDGRIAEFKAADLDNYVNARQHLIRGLTAKTRTPPHYVLGEIVNASGDALKAAETGLVAKVRKKMPAFEAGHEDMMRLAFKAMGDDTRAQVQDAEVIWRDPETRSQGELVDSLVKLGTLGIPQEVLWERAGFSPTEIARIKALQIADDVLGLTAPEPPAADGAVPTAPQNGQPTPVPAG